MSRCWRRTPSTCTACLPQRGPSSSSPASPGRPTWRRCCTRARAGAGAFCCCGGLPCWAELNRIDGGPGIRPDPQCVRAVCRLCAEEPILRGVAHGPSLLSLRPSLLPPQTRERLPTPFPLPSDRDAHPLPAVRLLPARADPGPEQSVRNHRAWRPRSAAGALGRDLIAVDVARNPILRSAAAEAGYSCNSYGCRRRSCISSNFRLMRMIMRS